MKKWGSKLREIEFNSASWKKLYETELKSEEKNKKNNEAYKKLGEKYNNAKNLYQEFVKTYKEVKTATGGKKAAISAVDKRIDISLNLGDKTKILREAVAKLKETKMTDKLEGLLGGLYIEQ